MESGVYYIRNKINGKTYIGQGQDVKKRMFLYHANSKALLNAFKSYGEENFEREVIEYCSIEELDALETYYIKEWNTLVPNGYNISQGGNAPMRGRYHSKKSKKKISDNSPDHNGENNPMFGKTGDKNPFFGRTHTDDSKRKMSESHTGQLVGEKNGMYGKDMSGKNNARFGNKSDDASSKYYGVYLFRNGKYNYWRAKICIKGKNIHIGQYGSEIEAAIGYDHYVIEHKLDYPLNFPEDYI